MEIYTTHTGKIYVDRDRRLEFLTVGDYGKENNIKANFLGYTKEINGVPNTGVDLSEKWVATISTQKGCPMRCNFCDVHKYGFFGNASMEDLEYQIATILQGEDCKHTKRLNVHYARMGEPTFNHDVLDFTSDHLREVASRHIQYDELHPVISTMLPKNNRQLVEFLMRWCGIKNYGYQGDAGLQFSINTTDDNLRDKQFNGMSLSLQEISVIADRLPMPVGRKYTLNFAVTKESILDAQALTDMFDKDKFIAKITPIHETNSAVSNGYDVSDSYRAFSVYESFEQPLLDLGWDVIVFVPSLEEDSDRITCGNALISGMEV